MVFSLKFEQAYICYEIFIIYQLKSRKIMSLIIYKKISFNKNRKDHSISLIYQTWRDRTEFVAQKQS